MQWWRNFKIAVASACYLIGVTQATESGNIKRDPVLSTDATLAQVGRVLLNVSDYHPFPTWQEHSSWQALPESVRKLYVSQAEKLLGYNWPDLPATMFLEFKRNGNRTHYEAPHFDRRTRLGQLVLAECMEGRGRFLDDIANGIWAICEESFWGVPAHISAQKAGSGLPDVTEPIVDLFAAETGSLLAWTHYLLGEQLDSVSPLLKPRIRLEIERRILQPCRTRDNFGWMGFHDRSVNNWNPWINSNWLACVLLMEQDNATREQTVVKILKSLDRFLAGYGDDGGCDEGPSYWGRAGASLFDNLELLSSASNKALNFYQVPLIQNIGRYIYRVHIAGSYFVNFADGPGVLSPPAELVYRYGKRINDPLMMQLALTLPRSGGMGRIASIGRELAILWDPMPTGETPAAAPMIRDHFFKDVQVMVARSQAGSSKGLYVAAKGGHNAESHNHNDVGHYIVYLDGQPMIIDAGVGTYTAKTFGPQRYEIWTMQSAYHSLPAIDGVMQAPGREFAARAVKYAVDNDKAELQLDIAGAYPAEAHLQNWLRTIRLQRNKEVLVKENYRLTAPVKEITLAWLTPCQVLASKAGSLRFISTMTGGAKAAEMELLYNAADFSVKLEEVPLDDERLSSVWGAKLTRVLLVAAKPTLQKAWYLHFRPFASR
jgi:hypothetical protein